MNIFVLDRNPRLAALYQCNKHVVKMYLESVQLLCGPFNEAPYRRTHYNHPCSIWTRQSKDNYEWLLEHAKALGTEYTNRYTKLHKSTPVLDWCAVHYTSLNLPQIGLTPFVLAMPDQYRSEDPVLSYRQFYIGEKSKFAKWEPIARVPSWWNL